MKENDRNERLFRLIGEASDRYLTDAKRPPRRHASRIIVPLVAAFLALLLLVAGAFSMHTGLLPDPTGTTGAPLGTSDPAGTTGLPPAGTTGHYIPPVINPEFPFNNALLAEFASAAAVYPLMAQMPLDFNEDESFEAYNEAYRAWLEGRVAQKEAYNTLPTVPEDFFRNSLSAFLSDTNGENRLFSPLNVYMALAILAEVTGSETRAEILTALGEPSIESLRTTASAIWNAHYCDDGAVKSILAASLWTDRSYSYVEETVDRIAKTYYASVFSGNMGSEDYNEALRAWLNEQTGGLLSDQIKDVAMKDEDLLAIATTLYFKASWQSKFYESQNTEDIFHALDGDILTTFMHQTLRDTYYWGERFTAASLALAESGDMLFILPDAGETVEDLLTDSEVLSLIFSESTYKNKALMEIEASIPRFDLSTQIDLRNGMQALGIRRAFDPSCSDFTPSVKDVDGIFITDAKHGVRVAIDEEGCIAAAYTVITMGPESVPPEYERVEFTVDRPFLFVIRSEVGLPLFVGVVNGLQG